MIQVRKTIKTLLLYCQLFSQSLVKQGGPHINAAITIAEE